MFTRKIKTVASIMESFRRAITELNEIVTLNTVVVDNLHAERNALDLKIEDVDLEIHQARGTAERLDELVFGPDPSNE